MRSIILVLVCVALGGCPPRSSQGPSSGAAGACLPAQEACVVGVAGVALIRTPKLWLVDLKGLDKIDAPAVLAAARSCETSQGCGAALPRSQIDALVGELAQAKVEDLPVTGGRVIAYRIPQHTVLEIGGDLAALEKGLSQVAILPPLGCPGCAPCIPAQCEVPPPIPVRLEDLVYSR